VGKRPADPFEALAGTVTDFDAEAVQRYQRRMNLPTPRPVPREPVAYAREDIHSMLTEIASSSWDSIYANASRPRRPLPAGAAPTATAEANAVKFRSSRQRADDRLQVWHAEHESEAPAQRPARPARPRKPEAVQETVAPAAVPVSRTRRALRAMGRTLEIVRKWFAPHGSVRLF